MTVREGQIEFPTLAQYSDLPMFNTKAVVQQTSVPAPTLRAWERRYKLLSPERANNDYRLYSERDIVMIRWLKERVDNGMSISQAIALFRHKAEEQQSSQGSSATPPSENVIQPPEIEGPAAFQVAIQEEQPQDQPHKPASPEPPSVRDWPTLNEKTTDEARNYTGVHNMRIAREKLIEAFNMLDEASANMLTASMLAIYPVEQVCNELITPTMWQIGQLWAEGEATVTVEHFASNFFRALLTNLYHVTPGPHTGPLVLVCSAPGEPHELAPLMLALFMRRQGVRVAYLGQSIETAGLMHTIRRLTPALVCISLTMPTYLTALIDLGSQIHALPSQRPVFAFGGQVFAHYPNVIAQIPGIYLNGDLTTTVKQLLGTLSQRLENNN